MDMREQFENALDLELRSVSYYCELANAVKDPTLRAILMNMMGDKYGHARTLAALLLNGG